MAEDPLRPGYGALYDKVGKKRQRVVIEGLNPQKEAPVDNTIRLLQRTVPTMSMICEIVTGPQVRQIPLEGGLAKIVRNPTAGAVQPPSRLVSSSGGHGLRIVSEVAAPHVIVLDRNRTVEFDAVIGASIELMWIDSRATVVNAYRATVREGVKS